MVHIKYWRVKIILYSNDKFKQYTANKEKIPMNPIKILLVLNEEKQYLFNQINSDIGKMINKKKQINYIIKKYNPAINDKEFLKILQKKEEMNDIYRKNNILFFIYQFIFIKN